MNFDWPGRVRLKIRVVYSQELNILSMILSNTVDGSEILLTS